MRSSGRRAAIADSDEWKERLLVPACARKDHPQFPPSQRNASTSAVTSNSGRAPAESSRNRTVLCVPELHEDALIWGVANASHGPGPRRVRLRSVDDAGGWATERIRVAESTYAAAGRDRSAARPNGGVRCLRPPPRRRESPGCVVAAASCWMNVSMTALAGALSGVTVVGVPADAPDSPGGRAPSRGMRARRE